MADEKLDNEELNTGFEPDEEQERQEMNDAFETPTNPVETDEDEEVETTSDRGALNSNVIRGIIAVVVIILLVLGGRFLHHQLTKNDKTGAGPSTAANVKQPGTNPQSGASTQGSGSTSSGTSSATTSSGTSGSATQVPNTGPGNVLAIFVGASFIVAGLHYAISRR